MVADINTVTLANQIDALLPLINDVPYNLNRNVEPEKLVRFQRWLSEGKKLASDITKS